MNYVVAYDVPEDRIRDRVAEILEGYGWRVQYSVFECSLEGNELEELSRSLSGALEKSKGGNVRFYRLCADCFGVAFGLGEVAPGSGEEPWLIV